MSIKSTVLGFLLSLLFLGSLIVVRPEWFLFYKSASYPIWMIKYLPRTISLQSFLVFLALLPVVIAAIDFRRAAYAVLLVVSIAPVAALLVYVLESYHRQTVLNLVANLVFHYFWIVGFHLLMPTVFLLAARSIFTRLTQKWLRFKN